MAAAEDKATTGKKGDESTKDELIEKLDELLVKYLHTVDAYQQSQHRLTSRLSSVSVAGET